MNSEDQVQKGEGRKRKQPGQGLGGRTAEDLRTGMGTRKCQHWEEGKEDKEAHYSGMVLGSRWQEAFYTLNNGRVRVMC